ncbi:MAG: DUF29 family protein [Azospirillum sp.]|nr:DUF29 family protein [Azospirillum sp.]
MGDPARLYDDDYFAWTQAQGAALRRVAAKRVNLDHDLDLENLAEEIESMGRSDWQGLQSALAAIVEHLLKLEYSPAPGPRGGWNVSVVKQRDAAEAAIEDSPSLERRIDMARAYARGRRAAAAGLTGFDSIDPAILPLACPYTLEQLRDFMWFPPNRHGLS